MSKEADNIIPERFTIDAQPVAAPEAVVVQDCARFTILTSRLIRLEYSPKGIFENRASQAFWYRRQPVPSLEVKRQDNQIEIRTDALALRYRPSSQGFTPASLSIELLNENVTWHFSERDRSNLFGTLRTLDNADGAQKLEKGLMKMTGKRRRICRGARRGLSFATDGRQVDGSSTSTPFREMQR